LKIGYAEGITGNSTEQFEIVDTEGYYVVRDFTIVLGLYDKPYIARGALQLRKKEEVKNIEEV